ncbi:MAG: hypothetical protein AAGA80_18600 [Cyanobacteria bacterium P01_F01_bin.143]
MTQPNFESMTQKELQKYFLAHRDNQAAFYAYIDKLRKEGNWIEMPPLKSLEDLDKHPDFLEHFRGNSKT